MENGLYTIDTYIEIKGFQNLVISGSYQLINGIADTSSAPILQFDFNSPRLSNNSSFFHIIDTLLKNNWSI